MNPENLFNKRVYGCAIVKSINANYNADFTKQPRTLPNGIVYATDKALKYTCRHFLYKNYAYNLDSNSNSDNKLLYYTRYKTINENGQFVPMSLKEIYEYLFGSMEKVAVKGNKSPKWMIYYFDGEKIIGKLQKKTQAEIKKYFESIDNKPEYAEIIEKIAKEANDKLKLDNGKIENIQISSEEAPFYFYVKGDNQIEKIDVDDELFESVIMDLDLHFFGGYNKLKILYNLLKCIDVRFFGATFTGDTNVSIHGPVQINHAQDRFFYQGVIQNLSYTEQIKSPVRNDKNDNAKGGDAEMTTIGSDSRTMEAHYVHNFSINPKNLSDHLKIANELNKSDEKEYPELSGLSVDDINKLKESLRCGATLYDSTSKAGVENEMLLWVELKDGSKQVIPNFTELISVTRNEEGKVEINLKNVQALLKQKHIDSQIESIFVYFDNIYTNILLDENKIINGYGRIKDYDKWNFVQIELNEPEKINKNE